MSDIEELIGQVMAAHDGEAPRTVDLLAALTRADAPEVARAARRPRQRHWPPWLLPVAAAAAVAAVMVGGAWAGGLLGSGQAEHHLVGTPSLACPARYRIPPPWVPAKPAGVDGRSRLVPLRTPTSAVVCGYDPNLNFKSLAGHLKGRTLTRHRRLSGGLAALVGDLAWMPRLLHGQQIACLTVLGPQHNYLIGLAYRGGGRIWVSTTSDPSGCILTSNGDFTGVGNVSAEANTALRTGSWPTRPQQVSCAGGGRLGQEMVMVPAGSTSLTICSGHDVRRLTSGYQRLVTALNALPTHMSTRGCQMRPPFHGQDYQLVFAYPQGPPVQVRITAACFPQIDNLSLQANSAKTIVPLIQWLLHFGIGSPQVTLRPQHGPVGTRVTVTGTGFDPALAAAPAVPVTLNRTFAGGCSLVGGVRVISLHVHRDGTLRGQFVITARGPCFQQPGRYHQVTPGIYQLAIGCMSCNVQAFLVTGTPRH
jgi:hypothetical protein